MNTATIFQLINERAKQTPNKVALQTLDKKPLTFSRLSRHIEKTVAHLNLAGIGRNDCIVVVLPNGAEMATALLSIASGAICAPLNPEYKEAEFDFFLTNLDAKLLVIKSGMKSLARDVAKKRGIHIAELSSYDGQTAGLFELSNLIPGAEPTAAGLSEPDDVALILHTSGTTSLPKMVPLSHKNIAATARNIRKAVSLSETDICVNTMPLFHIGGLIDLLVTPLAAGGSVVVTTTFSAPHLVKYLEEFKPTWCQVVPAMLQEILDHFKKTGHTQELIRSLRLIRCVAAPLPEKLQKDFEDTFGIPIIEVYGMTETTTLITTNPLPPLERKRGSVGLPAGPEVAIMDDTGKLLSPTQLGEVVVCGDSVMSGYRKANEENKKSFYGKWFRTGDLGYFDYDNYLYITGRIKDIINRGGEKISPQEVDDVLLTHPAIKEAATFSLPHDTLGEDVAAAVILREHATTSNRDLINFLNDKLAYFKIPRTLFFVTEIPKTQNGKIKRAVLTEGLKSADQTNSISIAPVAEPSSTIANSLATMWRGVLEGGVINVNDNFFDLGGDSLKAATFINELQEKSGQAIFVSAIFDAPTVAEFEAFIKEHHPGIASHLAGEVIRAPRPVKRTRFGSSKILQFKESINEISIAQQSVKAKNPTAVFVLCPPRSGSTLLRVMMVGNPHLFSPPELYLLPFNTLSDRLSWFPSAQRGHLEGNLRGLMQLKNCDADQAKTLMSTMESDGMSVQEYYGMLQENAGDRLLVDKTPFYCAHSETLRRVELYFENPLYIHLQRHPYGMIRSFEEVKMDQLWYPRLVGEEFARQNSCPYSSSEMGELVWLLVHQNIIDLLNTIPANRQHKLKYEDLVDNPELEMRDICRFLDIDFNNQMLNPLQDTHNRMTDGIYESSQMVGDVKFHQHTSISSNPANLWKTQYNTDFLSDETWAVANLLGYDETAAKANNREEFEF